MVGIAAVFGAISIFAADFWIKSAANARTAEVTVEVPAGPAVEFGTIVVATQPLRYGMPIAREMLSEIAWPQESLPEGAFAKIDALMAGGARVVLSPVEVSEPVLLSKLSGADGRATLSNLLSPGMRAVTIKTDEVAGVGGFITPGDRIDITLTRDAGRIMEVERAAKEAAGSTVTSEVVLENVKVLTVGQGADTRDINPKIVNSVTVEVNAEGAQKIALARTIGTLSLSLRSAGEAKVSKAGLMTISAFGGSVGEEMAQAANAVAAVASGQNEPKFKTIIVTRGTEEGQSYQVPDAR